ncbi:hypothetical protein [Tenacibaculum ovolyticum]|uniref:hypothetical protein n=1 Tax=Tenacibaculum ovolyticum TaxID=104270 RepID=UPI000410AFAF|nr:hypothetical protein [Tenacibaculum ovolyticum]
MQIVKQSLYLLFFCCLITSCTTIITNNNSNENDEYEKVRNLINEVYKTPYPYRNSKLKNEVFSENLLSLISEARVVEKKSSERIPESERRNIKPIFLIESEIFASLYEGYVSHSIKKITLDKNKYLIDIEFINDLHATKEVWIDKLIIIKENDLKLDNVIYNKEKTGVKDLKSFLASFNEEFYKSIK